MSLYNRRILLGTLAAGIALSPIPGARATVDEKNACAILQKADVEAAFSPLKFDSGKPGLTIKASTLRPAVSSCIYTSRGATAKDMVSVTLGLRRAQSGTAGITPEAAKADATHLHATPLEVAGLGNGAYWVSLGSRAFPVFELNVFRGKREWLVFSCDARTLDKSAVLTGLKQIAQATLARK